MRIGRYRMQNGRIALLPIFLAGVLTGILIVNLGKSILLDSTGVLDEYTLYHMKYMTVDSSALFYYILGLRFKSFFMLILFATTYLGVLICAGASFWYGLSAGAFLSVLLIRYGLKGIVFAALSVFPQAFFYVPAIAALLWWCIKLNRSIYLKRGLGSEEEHSFPLPGKLLQLAGICGILLLGCLAESFINPKIMGWLLDVF